MAISIHRPHTRPDSICSLVFTSLTLFQFTGLIRGPTYEAEKKADYYEISIHRPHTRPDAALSAGSRRAFGISIHRPHTRPDAYPLLFPPMQIQFQFTGLIRGPTPHPRFTRRRPLISIHRPHTRPDCRFRFSCIPGLIISIHRPHTRPDGDVVIVRRQPTVISIHRPHTRPDRHSLPGHSAVFDFNSQASYEARRDGYRNGRPRIGISIHRPHPRPDSTLT